MVEHGVGAGKAKNLQHDSEASVDIRFKGKGFVLSQSSWLIEPVLLLIGSVLMADWVSPHGSG